MTEKEILSTAARDLAKIRETKPLLHHITNFVVMNETANLTICLGALPVMAHAREEVEEMVEVAGALILNIGTLSTELVESMVMAGKRANGLNIPVILDPVGAGATALRTKSAKKILNDVKVDVIRGNAAELSIIGGIDAEIRGVESIAGAENLKDVARSLARKTGSTIAITGKEDIVTDGSQMAIVANGHELLSMVTGTGCMSTTMVGGFRSVEPDPFTAAVGGLVTFGIAGEKAASKSGPNPGTFHASLYDSLYSLTPTPGEIELLGRVVLE